MNETRRFYMNIEYMYNRTHHRMTITFSKPYNMTYKHNCLTFFR